MMIVAIDTGGEENDYYGANGVGKIVSTHADEKRMRERKTEREKERKRARSSHDINLTYSYLYIYVHLCKPFSSRSRCQWTFPTAAVRILSVYCIAPRQKCGT